jgi:hypothetical protein
MFGALLLAGQSADALVITPMFDTCWTAGCTIGGNVITPAPAGATTVVNNVIAAFEADFANPVNITIQFAWGNTAGSFVPSGASSTITNANFNQNYTLAQVRGFYGTAAGGAGATTVLQTANANLPAAYPNPGGRMINGVPAFIVPDAAFLALTGAAQNADPIQGFTGYATNFCGGGTCPYDFTGGQPGNNAIEFTAVVEHELSHAMGRIDFAFAQGPNSPQPLTPQDFFKYTCGTTNLDPGFNINCFSFNGGVNNPGGRTFSNQSDSGDWINFAADSDNAFIGQGQLATFSIPDIQLMCAEGWNDQAVCGTPVVGAPEPGTLALLGTALLGLAALRRRRRT